MKVKTTVTKQEMFSDLLKRFYTECDSGKRYVLRLLKTTINLGLGLRIVKNIKDIVDLK